MNSFLNLLLWYGFFFSMEILHNFKAICFILKTKEKIKEDPPQVHKQGIWIAM